MKNIVAAVMAALCWVSACGAVEAGIGFSTKNRSYSIYMPVKLNDIWVVEGVVSSSRNKYNNVEGGSYSYGSYRNHAFGVGVFWRRSVVEKTYFYVGSRFERFTGGGTTGLNASFVAYETEYRLSGNSISPTVGFEYFPTRNISLGADVGYRYSREHYDSYTYSPPLSFIDSYTRTSTEITNNFIVRMYF